MIMADMPTPAIWIVTNLVDDVNRDPFNENALHVVASNPRFVAGQAATGEQ